MAILNHKRSDLKKPFNHLQIMIISIFFITSSIIFITPEVESNIGGPDSFGYRWIDTNTTGINITYNWSDGITGGTSFGIANDDNSGYIDIGFNFPFYLRTYSRIAICDNGWASFTDQSSTLKTGFSPPYSSMPNALIAPFWIDMDPDAHGNIYYKHNNITSPKHLIVTWDSVPINIGSHQYNQTFQFILYENGSVLFQYRSINLTQSMSPVIGIEDHVGTTGLSYSAGNILNQSAIWFYYTYPEHELSVKSFSLKSWGQVNKPIQLKTTIENFGYTHEMNVNISLNVNGQPENWTGPLINIEPFDSREFSFTWTPKTSGNHTVGIEVTTIVGEPNIWNNYLNKTIDVRKWRGRVLYYRGNNDDYQTWFTNLKSVNIIVDEMTTIQGDITSSILSNYNVLMISYGYYIFSSSELTVVHNFINAGNGLIILGRYYDSVYNQLSSPYEITWMSHSGTTGNSNDIISHEITTNVQNAYLYSIRSKLEVEGGAKGLIYDTSKDKGLVLAISNESGSGRVLCYADPYGFDNSRITNANNNILSVQIMEWVIGDSNPPSKVRNFKAQNGKLGNQVNLSWTPNTERDLNGYYLYRGTTSGVYDSGPIFIPAGKKFYADKGSHIVDHTEYFYKIAAIDEVPNISNLSSEAKATPTDLMPPGTPQNYSVKDIGTGEALNISWNKNKESDVVEYRIYKSLNFEFTDPEMIVLSPNITYYIDTEIIEGNNYYYKISAVDEVPNESTLTIIKDGTPYDRIAPEQPTGFKVTDPGLGNTLILNWNHSQDSDLVDYLINRKDSKGTNKNIIVQGHANNHSDSDGLVDGETYRYRIFARDDSKLQKPNKSPPTPWENGIPTDTTYPDSPFNFTIIDESYSTETEQIHCLNLTWNNSGDSDLRGSIIYRYKFPNFKLKDERIIKTIFGSVNYYLDYDVEEGEKYYYKVIAFDEVPNESPPSTEQFAIPKDVTPPPRPIDFTVESLPEGSEIRITWTLQPESEIEGYRLYFKDNQTGEFVLLKTFNKTDNEYLQSGLINDRPYYYKIQSYDIIPNYSPFTSVITITPSDTFPPNKPVGLKVEAIDIGKALKISWIPNTDHDLTGYRIYRYSDTSESVAELIMAVNRNTTSVIDNGLVDKQTYRYYITALDEVPNESDKSAVESGMPDDKIKPSTPKDLTISLSDNKERVILSWTPNNESDVQYYHIYRSTDNSEFIEYAKVSFSDSVFVDSNVIGGDTYYYKIASADGAPNLSPRTKAVEIDVPVKESDQLVSGNNIVLIILVIIIIFILFVILIRKQRSKRTKGDVEGRSSDGKSKDDKPVPEDHSAGVGDGVSEGESEGIKVESIQVNVPPVQTMPQREFSTTSEITTSTGIGVGAGSRSRIRSEISTLKPQKDRTSLPPAAGYRDVSDDEYGGIESEGQDDQMDQSSKSKDDVPQVIQGKVANVLTYEDLKKPGAQDESETQDETIPLVRDTMVSSKQEEIPKMVSQQRIQEQRSGIPTMTLKKPSRKLPMILIPVDDAGEISESDGVRKDKDKGHVTILNPAILNVPKVPLRHPPSGVIIQPEKKKKQTKLPKRSKHSKPPMKMPKTEDSRGKNINRGLEKKGKKKTKTSDDEIKKLLEDIIGS